jgi:hypothetical protein
VIGLLFQLSVKFSGAAMSNRFFWQRALTKNSKSQQILAEIESLLDAGKYEDAKILATFVDYDASDRESRLHLLLINATLGGPEMYEEEIAQLANLSKLSAKEKELVGKIQLLTPKSPELPRWDFSPPSRPLAQTSEPTPEESNLARQERQEEVERRNEREIELGELKKQLAELSEAKNHALQSLQDTIDRDSELLQAKEAALTAAEQRYEETVWSLKNQLREKEQLLESGTGEAQAIGSEVNRLTAELNELARAKDQDVGLLRAELAQQAELSRTKDEAIKRLKQRFAEQIRRMQSQLVEKQKLLASREEQLGSVTARVNELSRERAELIAARQEFEQLSKRELGEKAELLEATASAIDELRDRSSAHVASLERQLAEHQDAIQDNVTHLAELRGQLRILTESLAKAELAQYCAEAMLDAERQRARESPPAADQAPRSGGTKLRNIRSMRIQQRIADWLSDLPRPWQMSWRPITLPKTVWPMAAGVTLIIPVAYFVFAQGRMAANPIAGSKQIRINEVSENATIRPIEDGQTMSSDNQNSTARDARKVRAVPYAYVTRRAVPLRAAPRYAATPTTPLGAGTPISVLETQGSWLKVEARSTGAVGYIRKEYVAPLSLARN